MSLERALRASYPRLLARLPDRERRRIIYNLNDFRAATTRELVISGGLTWTEASSEARRMTIESFIWITGATDEDSDDESDDEADAPDTTEAPVVEVASQEVREDYGGQRVVPACAVSAEELVQLRLPINRDDVDEVEVTLLAADLAGACGALRNDERDDSGLSVKRGAVDERGGDEMGKSVEAQEETPAASVADPWADVDFVDQDGNVVHYGSGRRVARAFAWMLDLAKTVLACALVLGGAALFIGVSGTMPDNAIVWLTPQYTYLSPPCLQSPMSDYLPDDPGLYRSTAGKARELGVRADPDCRDRFGLTYDRNLLKATWEWLGLPGARSRWNADGSWNW